MNAMDENLGKLQAFCDSYFTRPMTATAQLGLLERFNRLAFLGVTMDKPHQILLNTYYAELQETRRLYQASREDPTLARDMPPMAGRVFWARQLFKRIERVMAWVQNTCPQALLDKAAGKLIKLYNKLGKAFLDYELAYYNAWCKAIGDAENLLRCSLLVAVGDSGQLAVNWDPQVMQLIQETKFMRKLHLAVPESASTLLLLVPKLKATKLLMEELVDS
jgi:dynein heavy chain